MAGGIHIVAIDDLDLQTLELHELPLVIAEGSTSGEWGTRRRDDNAGSAFVAGTVQTAIWNVLFKCDDYEAHDALWAILSSDVSQERRLLAEREDPYQTRVSCFAAVLRVELLNELDIAVQFEARDSTWRAADLAVTSKTFSAAGDRAMRVAVPGNTVTRPRIVVRPTAQRSGSSVYAGWRYRKRYEIAWDGDAPLVREPIRISLGNTTALVAGGKAQADGDDVRVWLDGVEQPRTLITWNTSASYAWVIVPLILPGESLVYEMVYGNPSATNPPNLAYPDEPAFDLSTSSNAWLAWAGDPTSFASAGEGAWHLFSSTSPAAPDFGIPSAWRPARTINNPDNQDRSCQWTWIIGSGALSGYVMAGLTAQREPAQGTTLVLTNVYDGIEFYSPMPITSLYFGYTLYNPGLKGGLYILSRLSSAHLWGLVARDITTGNVSPTNVAPGTYTLPTPSMHVSMAVWPSNGWEWRDADGGFVTVSVYSAFALTRDDSDLSITASPAEEEIYEFALELQVGGGEQRVPPYHALVIGNARQETGKGTPRLACTLTQALVIDTETGDQEIWSVSGGELAALVERASAHAITPVVGWDNMGETVESPSSDWLTLAPARKQITNGTFRAGIAGWAVVSTPAGMTATPSWDGAAGGEELGSLKVAITPSTAGAGQFLKVLGDQAFLRYGQVSVDLAAWVLTSNPNLTPRLGVRWYRDDAGTSLISELIAPDWTPGSLVEAEVAASFAAPGNARSYRALLIVSTDTANQTGNVWFDDVRFADRDLLLRDEAMGTLEITTQVAGVWL